MQDPLGDLMSMGGMSASPSFPSITAYQKNNIAVTFAFTKTPGQPHLTTITGTYVNHGGDSVADFSLQAAVPKFMQLKLDPPSGTTLPPFGSSTATQSMHINNTMHGQKPLVMRLRIAYTLNGQPALDQTEVGNFPAGL
jgi:AP-1 complex subunit gamma-1